MSPPGWTRLLRIQTETIQGGIKQCASAVEDKLALDAHVECAAVLLEFPQCKGCREWAGEG
jgi:hypothetical protein